MYKSEVSNSAPAEWAAILALADPLLNTFSVEDVLLIADKSSHVVIAAKITPANGALLPEPAVFLPFILLFGLSLLVLELGLVQRRQDLGNGQWDRQQATEQPLNEHVSVLILILSVDLAILAIWRFLLNFPPSHHRDSALYNGFDQTGALGKNYGLD